MRKKIFSFQNGTTTGILRNLFESPNYWQLFTYHATTRESTHQEQFAFNFSTEQYWIGVARDIPNNLSFCFHDFSIIATGYELNTSKSNKESSARANKWGFSGSNDGINWQFFENVTYPMKIGEKYFVPWSPNIPFRCFQLTTIESTNQGFQNRFDVISIDIYGQILLNTHSFIKKMNPTFLRFFMPNLLLLLD